MSFQLNWAVFFIGLITFSAGFILKPLALLLREKAVWWWINKYLVNDNFWRDVDSYTLKHCLHRHHYNYPSHFKWDKNKGTSYSIVKNDEEFNITERQYAYYTQQRDKSLKELNKEELAIQKKHNTYKLLLKHFGHDEVNSIEDEINRLIDKQESKLAGTQPLVEKFIEVPSRYDDVYIEKILSKDRHDAETAPTAT